MNFKKVIRNGNSEYLIKELQQENEKDLKIFNEKCWDYYKDIEGRKTIVGVEIELLNELPPDKNLMDKFVFGVYKNDNNLIAVIDIIKDYKLEKEWTIGLLLLEPNERNKGLGIVLHDFLLEWVTDYQAKKFRLGVVEENHIAINFWIKLGYEEIDRVDIMVGENVRRVILMNYFIK